METIRHLFSDFSALECCWLVFVDVFLALALGFYGAPLLLWTGLGALCLFTFGAYSWMWIIFAVMALVFNIPLLRRYLVTFFILKTARYFKIVPKISETERTALEAGDVWVEADLFSGKPNFKKLLAENYPVLTEEERAFINGPVEEVCALANDWETWKRGDLSKQVWESLKKHGFFGMIIPKEYGGLGFSVLAHSEVVMKLSSRCIPLAVTTMVPNALGPAELLIHYGTERQKKKYLPRLATGEEIPCFALTEPLAGSDAGSISADGVLFKGEDDNLLIRLNWDKRYITLAGVATLIGLAFKLKDPEQLLGSEKELGITCALIPADAKGVEPGQRHDPLGVPFFNGPTRGCDVIVSVDCVVGGKEGLGCGWKMLMECLAAGRGISLPAQSTGGAKLFTRVVSAYTAIRKQFGISIGKFEGIAAPMARIGGITYLLEAGRRYTLGALDQGRKPPVTTAIMKYNFTELVRKTVNDGMDIVGGAGISRGPRNLFAHTYIALPIAITVEGANILTRTLIVFGQGALRAHPYAYGEISAIENDDLIAFDKNMWGHVGHIVRNLFRAKLLSLTRGRLAWAPGDRHMARYIRKLSWASATFALLADIAMALLGGKLKFRGKIIGRFADILSWMYLATAVLRRYDAEGRRKEDRPFLDWSMQYALAQIQAAFEGILGNMNAPLFGLLLRPALWWFRANPLSSMPCDKLDAKIATLMQIPGEQRNRLTENIYMPKQDGESLAEIEKTFELTHKCESLERRIRKAVKSKALTKESPPQIYCQALDKQVITQEELELLNAAYKARYRSIQVDSFSLEEYHNNL